jgi:hypothetical protein
MGTPSDRGGESNFGSEFNTAYGDPSGHQYEQGAPGSCNTCSQPPSRH